MQRITVTLTDEIAELARHEADRLRTSVSAVVRDAVTARLGGDGRPRDLPFASVGRSGRRTTTARDAEEILAAEWGDRIRDR